MSKKTPCEKLGYKVGDRFEVTGGLTFGIGSIVELYSDGADSSPVFKLISGSCDYTCAEGEPGAYASLTHVKPLKQPKPLTREKIERKLAKWQKRLAELESVEEEARKTARKFRHKYGFSDDIDYLECCSDGTVYRVTDSGERECAEPYSIEDCARFVEQGLWVEITDEEPAAPRVRAYIKEDAREINERAGGPGWSCSDEMNHMPGNVFDVIRVTANGCVRVYSDNEHTDWWNFHPDAIVIVEGSLEDLK